LRARTQAVARHLTDFLKKTDRFAKTIVFCVDQEHASEMRTALNNLNADLVAQASPPAGSGTVPVPGRQPVGTTGPLAAGTAALPGLPDYVCRVTADRGRHRPRPHAEVPGRGNPDPDDPHHLATAHHRPGCAHLQERRVSAAREFDGRSSSRSSGAARAFRDDYGKLWFNILDYHPAPPPATLPTRPSMAIQPSPRRRKSMLRPDYPHRDRNSRTARGRGRKVRRDARWPHRR